MTSTTILGALSDFFFQSINKSPYIQYLLHKIRKSDNRLSLLLIRFVINSMLCTIYRVDLNEFFVIAFINL